MTSRATTRSTAAAADATIKDEIIAETMKGVSDIVARQGLSGNSMPPIFTGDNMDAVEWMDIFELYASAGKWDDETKILKMNISMRARGIRWLKSATQPDDTWVNRKSSFIKYFKPADLLEHAEFVACQQNEEEPTQLYIERYLKLADQIKTTMDESEKVNRLIFGLLPHVRDLILIHGAEGPYKQFATYVKQVKSDAFFRKSIYVEVSQPLVISNAFKRAVLLKAI